MAKQSLTSYLNAALKKKGMSSKEAQKNAGKYSSIKAAKAAGSLYYTNKKGQVMAAVYAEDLKEKLGSRVAKKGDITITEINDGVNRDEVIPPERKVKRRGVDPLNLAGPKKRKGAAKGGMMSKKSTGYNKGGMPMVMKDGKKVPAYAADGVGKMNKGGAVKKKPAAKMMAGGMTKKKPAAKMMGGGMSKSGYMYGGMAKKKKK